MRNFRVVCFLAFALCFVFCFSANAKVNEDTARKAVEDAKNKVEAVSKKAKGELKDAKFVLQKVESSKRRSEKAESQSETTAKDNAEAEEIATKIKKLSEAVVTLHPDAKQKLDTAVSRLEEFVSEAKTLEDESNINIAPNQGASDDFTDTNNKASELKTKAVELEKNITDVINSLTDVYSTADNMEENSKKAQLADIEVSAIVAVAQIKSMVKDADANIDKMEKKRSEISGIIEEMKEIRRTAPKELFIYINGLCSNAEHELSEFSDAMDSAKKFRASMQEQKDNADAALAMVKESSDVREGRGQAQLAELYVKNAKKIVPQVESALLTADISARTANHRKQDAVAELAKYNSKPPTEDDKVTKKTDLPEAEGAGPSPNDAKVKPTIIKTEQTMSKELLRQSKNNSENPVQDTTKIPKRGSTIKTTAINIEKTVFETSENSMRQASDQPGIVQSEEPKGKHSEILKDKLRKDTQNETAIALIGKNIPASSAENDSSVTVSVPLLVALIASAVLQ